MSPTADDDASAADPEPGQPDRLRYLLTLSRPRFWLYLAGPVAVGVVYGASAPAALVSLPAIALVAYFLAPANVLLYGVNDAFDVEIDATNPKKGGGTDSRRPDTEWTDTGGPDCGRTATESRGEAPEARWRGDPVVAAVVVGCGLVGLGTFAVTPRIAWPYLAGFFLLAVAYSAPPLRFKTTPLADSASNGLYILPGAAAYATVAGAHPPAFALVGAWLWTMAMHTFSAIPDIDPDREAGIRTTATVLGETRTYGYCFGCWTGAALAFAAVDVRLAPAFAVYPLFVAWVATGDVAVDRAYWWFPALNTVVGAALTIGGLWQLFPLTGGL